MGMQRPDIREVIIRLAEVNTRFHDIPTEAKSGSWTEVCLCPLHEDQDTKSFNVNFASNTFWCFGCGRGGTSWTLLGYAVIGPNYNQDNDWQQVMRWWENQEDFTFNLPEFQPIAKPPFDVKKYTGLVKRWESALFFKRDLLLREHGVTSKAALEFGLGYADFKTTQYFTIPYYLSNGKLAGVNMRYILRKVPPMQLRYNVITGSNRKTLYNGKALLNPANKGKRVFVVEDELSVIHLWQYGELAVSRSASANRLWGNLQEEWLTYFQDVFPIVIPDMDDTGQSSAGNASVVLGEAPLADLPPLPGVKDFADLSRLYPEEAKAWLQELPNS